MKRESAGALDATLLRLYLVTFVSAMGTSTFTIAVPFYVLAQLGNDRPDAVGYVVTASTIGYLISCLVVQSLTRRINPRLAVTVATAGAAGCMFAFAFTTTLPQMVAAILMQGLFLGLLWAPLMGWISGSAEGTALSRRLGLFNLSWSSSLIIAPPIAGHIAETSTVWPVHMMGAFLSAATLLALLTRHGRRPADPPAVPEPAAALEPQVHEADTLDEFGRRYIRYLAWAGLTMGYMAIGVYRYQMPHLAKTVGMPEGVFGVVMMMLSLGILIAFAVGTRWSGWHGRTAWIFGPQAVLALGALLLTGASSEWVLGPLVLVAGLCGGVLYTNSIFYGSLGADPSLRTRRMAIHEIMLSIGVIIGNSVGNLLSRQLGPSHVYPYLAGAIAVVVAAQLAAWGWLRLRHARAAQATLPAGLTIGGGPSSVPVGLKPALNKQQ